MRLTPSTLRSVAGLATAGLLAGGFMVHGASAATYACPTFTDPAGDDTTLPEKDPDIDLTAVTYTVADNRFQAILKVAKLEPEGPAAAVTDIFRTTFTVAGKAASFSAQRDFFPSSTTTVVGTVDGKSVSPAVVFDVAASTVTLSAAVDAMNTAAGTTLTGQAFSAMKASSEAQNRGVPAGAGTDSAAAPETAAYAFGNTCAAADPTGTPTDEPTDVPTDEPTGEPTDVPTDEPTGEPTDEPTGEPTGEPSGDPSGTPTETSSPAAMPGYVGLPAPVRILDTRPGTRRVGTVAGPVRGTFSFPVGDQVPAGATAVVLNVTSTGGATAGNLVVHRDGTASPNTSSLNWAKGATQANEVTSASTTRTGWPSTSGAAARPT